MSVFLLFVILFPVQLLAGVVDDSVSADNNMELINKKIEENEQQFKDFVVEAKKHFKNFDWDGFEDLPDDAQRIVIKNYLAQEAFQEIEDNFKKDIYKRAKNQVEAEDYGRAIYYFSLSDKLYRTDYVSKNITERAKQQNLLYPTEGANLFYFKQKDVATLDKIIKEEIAKSPADMHCDKECIRPANSIGLEWYLDPYNENCEMITFACFNVERIPESLERMHLSISEIHEPIEHIMYVYDDLNEKQHIESSASKSCDCSNKNTDINKYLSCRCYISFYDTTTDFDEYRKYENQDRIDIKNGKLQDRTDDGKFLHDWEGNYSIPVGHVYGRTLYMRGNESITTEKNGN